MTVFKLSYAPRLGDRTAEARRTQRLGLASRVSGLGFEREIQDSGLGTENYLSANSVPLR
jgi:hypothetical protein